MHNQNGTIARSYRREMSKNSRLAAASLLNVGLGAAAQALAKRESARADQERATRSAYFNTVQAILDATA